VRVVFLTFVVDFTCDYLALHKKGVRPYSRLGQDPRAAPLVCRRRLAARRSFSERAHCFGPVAQSLHCGDEGRARGSAVWVSSEPLMVRNSMEDIYQTAELSEDSRISSAT